SVDRLRPNLCTLRFSQSRKKSVELWDAAKIVVQAIGSTERKTLVEGAADARYLPSGHIVYAVRGILFAQRFDARKLQLVGTAQPVLEGVERSAGNDDSGVAQFAVPNTGTLLFVSGPANGREAGTDLAITDTTGGLQPLKLPGAQPGAAFFSKRTAAGGRPPHRQGFECLDL